MKKKVIRLTESDLMNLVKRIIKEDNKKSNKQNINEGVGMILGIAAVSALGYALYKVKKFIDRFAKFTPTVSVGSFLAKIKNIETEGENSKYRVKVKSMDGYKIIAIVEEDNRIFDSLTIDTSNNVIYSGHDILKGEEPSSTDIIIPMTLPEDANTEDLDKIKSIEDDLVRDVLKAVTKYDPPKFDKSMFR